ncbi:MAG: DUF362 domain-containing protein [Pseudomonadota bacterium]
MKEKVLICRCDTYDPDLIEKVIGRGMDELGIVPKGRVLVKPNLVIAHKDLFPHAFTRPEFTDGLLAAVKARGKGMSELAVGERCGITMPTRFVFSNAGYNKIVRKHGVKRYFFDECVQVERRLKHPDRLRDTIYIPQPIDECDFLISLPKLKSHPWTRITIALKNFIGLQNDPHRLIDHDYMLETKIADLQEVIQPSFIAVDAIMAGELKMLTPKPYHIGAILMGTNPVAIDTVACAMIGFDPYDVPHLKKSAERGYGPIEIDDVELGGDYPLEEARKKAKKFRVPIDKVDADLNTRTNLTTYVGKPPNPKKSDYCWGGCPGSLIEAMEIVKTMQPDVDREVRSNHYVFGHYEGEINARPGEKVILCGDCAAYKGEICGREINEKSRYVIRHKKNPANARAKDLVARIIMFILNIIFNHRKQVIRARGCPVSVAENVLYLWQPGGTINPYFDPRIVLPFAFYYVVSNIVILYRRTILRQPEMMKKKE